MEDIIEKEAGAILPLIVLSYQQMVQYAPKNSEFKDWIEFIPYFQKQVTIDDPLKKFLEDECDYSPRERQTEGSYIYKTITLRQLQQKYPNDITWQELEQRLPGVLSEINREKMFSYSYDKGTYYISTPVSSAGVTWTSTSSRRLQQSSVVNSTKMLRARKASSSKMDVCCTQAARAVGSRISSRLSRRRRWRMMVSRDQTRKTWLAFGISCGVVSR